jgi:TolA-binding protein
VYHEKAVWKKLMNKRLLTVIVVIAAAARIFAQTAREPFFLEGQERWGEHEPLAPRPQNSAAENGSAPELSAPAPLSRQTAQILKSLTNARDSPALRQTPKAFSGDLRASAGEDAASLGSIVRGVFANREWDAARTALLHYLSLPQTEQAQARARYYLGQTYYFSGQYREALLEFLSVRTLEPAEVSAWIDAALAALVH